MSRWNERWASAKKEWLCERLELPSGTRLPSHDTFGRVFARLDACTFAACFAAWTRTLHEQTQGEVIALDGKHLRHSFDAATGKAALHLVSAWACKYRLSMAHKAVEDKSNEITALPALLSLLDVRGCLVTIDAMSFTSR